MLNFSTEENIFSLFVEGEGGTLKNANFNLIYHFTRSCIFCIYLKNTSVYFKSDCINDYNRYCIDKTIQIGRNIESEILRLQNTL